jgi:uncharacterized protein YfaP (DUF2135 family)
MAHKGAIAVVLLLLVGYGLLEARHLLSGPSLSIDIPSNYTTFPDGFVTLSGTTNNTQTLIVNGGLLPIDEEGRFEKTLVLAQGGSILSLTATDRFGRSVTERRTIFIP